MKKNISKYITILIVLFICYETLTHSDKVISSIQASYEIWVNNVFPTLFPIITLSKILLDLDFPTILGRITRPITKKIFNFRNETSFIFIMSMLSGSPSNAIFAKELYEKNKISLEEASKSLLYTHFSSPLFILGSISNFLDNKKISIFILIIHYITNVIIAIIFRKSKINSTINKINEKNTTNISSCITNSITHSINTCLMILGVICISTLLITIIKENLSFNDNINTIISGLIEMTNGIKDLAETSLSLKIKTTLSIFFISFGGLSIHLQILSVLNNSNIKYSNFFIGRLIHAIISSILSYILFDIFI